MSRLADVPVVPDAQQGRAWAREELAGPGYERPGLVRRGLEWLIEQLQHLPLPHGSGSALTAAVLLVVVAAVVVWALLRGGGPLARRRAGDGDAVFEPGARSAEQHRADADRAAGAGQLVASPGAALLGVGHHRHIGEPAHGIGPPSATACASRTSRPSRRIRRSM